MSRGSPWFPFVERKFLIWAWCYWLTVVFVATVGGVGRDRSAVRRVPLDVVVCQAGRPEGQSLGDWAIDRRRVTDT